MARRRFLFRTLVCATCAIEVRAFVEDGVPAACPCGGQLVRPDPIAPGSPTVFDDTLWGGPRYIENLASAPIWVETKSEYRALLAAHGMEQKVRHMPTPGSDKSPHTTRWDIGLPPGVDARPFAMLSPDEQVARRAEAAERLGFTVEQLAGFGENLASAGLELPWPPTPACEFTPDR